MSVCIRCEKQHNNSNPFYCSDRCAGMSNKHATVTPDEPYDRFREIHRANTPRPKRGRKPLPVESGIPKGRYDVMLRKKWI